MSRAEQRALEAFPESYSGHNEYDRKCFVYGYEQAEKDAWKPTKEQLDMLKDAIAYYGNNWVSKKQKLLESLYNDLRNLIVTNERL